MVLIGTSCCQDTFINFDNNKVMLTVRSVQIIIQISTMGCLTLKSYYGYLNDANSKSDFIVSNARTNIQ